MDFNSFKEALKRFYEKITRKETKREESEKHLRNKMKEQSEGRNQ